MRCQCHRNLEGHFGPAREFGYRGLEIKGKERISHLRKQTRLKDIIQEEIKPTNNNKLNFPIISFSLKRCLSPI